MAERIGIESEALVERVQRKGSALDAVVVREDAAKRRTRARIELGTIGALQRIPALGLRVAAGGHCGGQPGEEHPLLPLEQ